MLSGPSDVSLQQCLDETGQHKPSSSLFQSQPLESATKLSSVTRISFGIFSLSDMPQSQPPRLPDSSELFNPGGGLCPLSGQPASAGLGCPPLSELLLTARKDVTLEGICHFSHESVEEKQEDAHYLLKIQNQLGVCALFQDMKEPSQE